MKEYLQNQELNMHFHKSNVFSQFESNKRKFSAETQANNKLNNINAFKEGNQQIDSESTEI